MTRSQARRMLGEAFGPGDLADKIQELQPRPGDFGDFTMENADKLMDWMAEQLTDEEGE